MCVTFVHSHDAGADDLLVWFLAANEYRTTATKLVNIAGAGCVNAEQAALNAELFHSWIPSVQLFAPRLEKLSTPPTNETFFGDNGFNDVDLQKEINAPRMFLAQACRDFPDQFIGPLHWLETGPCTTLARALLRERGLLRTAIQEVTIMGGAFDGPGIVGKEHPATGKPCAEFNFYHDALAVQSAVFMLNEQGVIPQIVPWESCQSVYVSLDELSALKGRTRVSEALRRVHAGYFSRYHGDPVPGATAPVYVPADVVAWYASQGLFGECRERQFAIECDTDTQLYGATWFDPNGKLCARIYSVTDSEGLKSRFFADMGWE